VQLADDGTPLPILPTEIEEGMVPLPEVFVAAVERFLEKL
jgi:hypothetical protein